MVPKIDGEITLKELKKDDKFKIPVIAVAADAVSGVEEKYLNAGFAVYISKPFTKNELIGK